MPATPRLLYASGRSASSSIARWSRATVRSRSPPRCAELASSSSESYGVAARSSEIDCACARASATHTASTTKVAASAVRRCMRVDVWMDAAGEAGAGKLSRSRVRRPACGPVLPAVDLLLDSEQDARDAAGDAAVADAARVAQHGHDDVVVRKQYQHGGGADAAAAVRDGTVPGDLADTPAQAVGLLALRRLLRPHLG